MALLTRYMLELECYSLQMKVVGAMLQHTVQTSTCFRLLSNKFKKFVGCRKLWKDHLCTHDAYTALSRNPSELGWSMCSRQLKWKATPQYRAAHAWLSLAIVFCRFFEVPMTTERLDLVPASNVRCKSYHG